MKLETRLWLQEQIDEGYKRFQQALLPGVQNYMGVRLPLLKKRAAALAKGDWAGELACADETYEENMMRGLIIGQLGLPINEKLALIAQFVPTINNWAVCDSFCSGIKNVADHRQPYFELAVRFSTSDKEYEARFAAVLLLWHFASGDDLAASFAVYKTIRQPDFYARMAVAWGYSIFATTDFAATIQAMRQAGLDDFTWNKALQKMRESRRITPQQKQLAADYKRKKTSAAHSSATQ